MLLTSSVENQKFYINQNFISGVQSLSFNYDSNINPSFYISDTGMNYIISQPIIANFSMNYIPGDLEPFIDYTGNSFFTGRLEYSNKLFEFSSGYIENYSIYSEINRPTEVSVQGKIYGILAYNTGLNASSGSLNYNLNPINYCYLDLNINEANLNRLNNCSINYNARKIPLYNIGEYLPFQVIQEYPIEISTNINFEISEEILKNPTGLFSNLDLINLSVNFKNINNSSVVKSFNIINSALANKTYNFNANENGTFSLNYKGYINN